MIFNPCLLLYFFYSKKGIFGLRKGNWICHIYWKKWIENKIGNIETRFFFSEIHMLGQTSKLEVDSCFTEKNAFPTLEPYILFFLGQIPKNVLKGSNLVHTRISKCMTILSTVYFLGELRRASSISPWWSQFSQKKWAKYWIYIL